MLAFNGWMFRAAEIEESVAGGPIRIGGKEMRRARFSWPRKAHSSTSSETRPSILNAPNANTSSIASVALQSVYKRGNGRRTRTGVGI
jgi:hypothetical protein